MQSAEEKCLETGSVTVSEIAKVELMTTFAASYTFRSNYKQSKQRFSERCDAFLIDQLQYLVRMAKDRMLDWHGTEAEDFTPDDIMFNVLANYYIEKNPNMSVRGIKKLARKELKAERPVPECEIFHFPELTPELLQKAIRLSGPVNPHFALHTEVFVVQHRGKWIGCAIMRNNNLGHIYVDPQYRKQGYGQTLFMHIKRVKQGALFVKCSTDESVAYFKKFAKRTALERGERMQVEFQI